GGGGGARAPAARGPGGGRGPPPPGPPPRPTARRRARLESAVLRVAPGPPGALPLWLSFRIGEAVALLVYWLAAPLRRVGLINLAIAFPDKPLAERKRILRESILNFGRMVAELAHLPHLSDEQLREMVRFEAAARGR